MRDERSILEAIGIPDRPEQAIPFFREKPSALLGLLEIWWEDAVENARCYIDGIRAKPAKGFYSGSRLIVLWCDAELRTIEPAALRDLSDQIWARNTKIVCLKCRGGHTFFNGTCDNCGDGEHCHPNWTDARALERTLDRAQPIMERILAVTLLACKQAEATNLQSNQADANDTEAYTVETLPAEYREGGKAGGQPLVTTYLECGDWSLNPTELQTAKRKPNSVKMVKVRIDGKLKNAYEYTTLAAFRRKRTLKECDDENDGH